MRFKGVINKQAATSPQATTLLIPNFKFLFAFLRICQPLSGFNDHPKVNALLIIVHLKRNGNFKWIEIIISLLVLSLTFQLKANDRVWTNFVYLFTC